MFETVYWRVATVLSHTMHSRISTTLRPFIRDNVSMCMQTWCDNMALTDPQGPPQIYLKLIKLSPVLYLLVVSEVNRKPDGKNFLADLANVGMLLFMYRAI